MLESPMPVRSLLCAVLFLSLSSAQTPPPQEVAITAEPNHHAVLENEYTRVFRAEILPHDHTLIHRHDHDYVYVPLGDSEVENTVTGKPPVQIKLKDGEARFLMGGFSHTSRNLSDKPFRCVIIELLRDRTHAPAADFAAPSSPAQKVLFIQDGVRVSEIRLARGAALPRHEHKFPHLVVAVTEISLTSQADGRPPRGVHQKSGDAIWIPAGLTHTLTNSGTTEARFLALEFQ